MSQQGEQGGAFSSRKVFILAAIGSAVGLGNIGFPYVAYENGGGAFVIPSPGRPATAGIPFLFLDYAEGHATAAPRRCRSHGCGAATEGLLVAGRRSAS